ncbi:MAG: Na+/H+ antiporter subunit C [Hyphomicrobiales bacterium]|nr:MAG: Na+/H+ antiporter subunit C [Hyphomicrobiales bacterium]
MTGLFPSDGELLQIALYGGAVGLLLVGLYGMVAERNLMRILLGLALVEAGVNMFLVAVGFRAEAVAPILTGETSGPMVDPLPQALVLTAIVIGVGVLAFGLALAIKAKAVCNTLDVQEMAAIIAKDTDDVPVPPDLSPAKHPVEPTAPVPVAGRTVASEGGAS